MRNKKAAIELSIGTVVIIVLAMTMLILGLVLVRTIFSGGQDIVELTNDQILSQVNKLFGEDKKLVIYPATDTIKVKQGDIGGFAIVISNKLSGVNAQNAEFDYQVTSVSVVMDDCGISETELESLFVAGSDSDSRIPISTGDPKPIKILFDTNEGDPLCTVRFRVDVTANGKNYDYAFVFVEFTD